MIKKIFSLFFIFITICTSLVAKDVSTMMAQSSNPDPWERGTTISSVFDIFTIKELSDGIKVIKEINRDSSLSCQPQSIHDEIVAFCKDGKFKEWEFSGLVCYNSEVDSDEEKRLKNVEMNFNKLKNKAIHFTKTKYGFNPIGIDGQKIYDTDRKKWFKAFESFHLSLGKETAKFFDVYSSFAKSVANKLIEKLKSSKGVPNIKEKIEIIQDIQVVSLHQFITRYKLRTMEYLKKQAIDMYKSGYYTTYEEALKAAEEYNTENTGSNIKEILMQCGLSGSVQGGFFDRSTRELVLCPGTLLYAFEYSDHSRLWSNILSQSPYLSKYQYDNVDWTYLTHIIGHEITHSIDAYFFKDDYKKMKECLSERLELPTMGPFLNEIIADYSGINVLLTTFKDVQKEKAFSLMKRYYRNLCDTYVADSYGHLSASDRLDYVIARHPGLRKFFGCKSIIPSCTLQGYHNDP